MQLATLSCLRRKNFPGAGTRFKVGGNVRSPRTRCHFPFFSLQPLSAFPSAGNANRSTEEARDKDGDGGGGGGRDDFVTAAFAILASGDVGKNTRQTSWKKGRVYSQKELEASFLRRLNGALEEKNLKHADDIWSNARVWYASRENTLSGTNELLSDVKGPKHVGKSEPLVEGPQRRSRLKMPVHLYNRFMLVFMALRQHDRAVDVWNDMVLAGQQPTVTSWHAFIDGCRKARDAKGIEDVWKRMLAAGVRPDAWCWTTRIHGLIDCGKWELGIEALQQMGMIWLEAAKSQRGGKGKRKDGIDQTEISAMGDVGDSIKPNTATINATISALLRQRRVDAAERVLRWASSLGIPSDVITFNTLLRPMIKTGNISGALGLVKEMESLGVKPDVATFTIIIDGFFRNPSALTSPTSKAQQNTQTTAITNLLAEMEAVGIPANVRSYGTLIDGLLNIHKNLPATRTILAHMASRGIKPSTHIYTILLVHYFSQSPPDLPAVEALWRCIRLDSTCIPDLVFYERMIEGYAQVGDTAKMLYFLNRLPREGKAPSWHVLGKVVRTLVEKEDWVSVAAVVRDVMQRKGVAEGGVKGWNGKDEFWALVKVVEGRWRNHLTTS